MATVSRLILNHPALGTTGGVALHASVEALYQKIGDAISSRWYQLTDFDTGESVDVTHNFDADITTIRWDLYVYTGGQWVRVTTTSSPARSAFTVVEKTGDEDNAFTITNVSGGNDLLAALVLVNDPLALNEGDVTDIDVVTVPPQDGQAMVYESSSGKWKPGASGDASFKLQTVATPNLTLKGGSIIDGDNEYSTYDGSGTASTDYGTDQTLNLTTILGTSPADATTYFLFIDKFTLSTEATLTDNGRLLYAVQQANYVLSTTRHRDTQRYVYIGFIRSATTGNAWSGTGAAFGTEPFRRHDGLAQISMPETFIDETITTAVASTSLNHQMSGEPHGILLTYDDGTTEVGLDPSGHLLDITATQIKVASLGLTFGGGQKVRVRAWRFPTQPSVAFQGRQFVSGWFQNTATTTLPHGLADIEDIKAYVVEEWNVSTGRYRLMDPTSLVVNFDGTNFYLNWTGLVPSATLQYRVIAGSSPLVAAIPLQYGGFNKFVGIGPGSYATLTAAIASAAPNDSILVSRDTTEPSGDLTIGVADLRIRWMPGVTSSMSGAMTNGLRLTAARIKLEAMQLKLTPTGTQARGVSIEAADCKLEGRVETNAAQTFTDLVHITSGGARTCALIGVLRTLGTITNLETNNDGAGFTQIWGG